MTQEARVVKVLDPFGTHGEVIVGKGFYISYNPNPAPMFGSAGPETALVKGKNIKLYNRYYILRGRWIDEYLPLVPKGWKKCLAFYNVQKELYGSQWSEG